MPAWGAVAGVIEPIRIRSIPDDSALPISPGNSRFFRASVDKSQPGSSASILPE